ncbi:Piwi-domain-containing protein [Clavulina sp. PMI_390]|nr:Piwi-domain-containing protein [Clavulina sp. PMI_390]
MSSFPALVFEHDVQFNTAASDPIKRRLFQLLEQSESFQEFASFTANDGSQRLVSMKDLQVPPSGTLDIPIQFYEEDQTGPSAQSKTYVLSIGPGKPHDTASLQKYLEADPGFKQYDRQPVISALQLLVAKHLRGNAIPGRDNRWFFPSLQLGPLDDLLVAIRGFTLSVRPTWKQLSVNINVATGAFYQESNLAQALIAWRRRTQGASATTFFFGVKVRLSHNGFKKSIVKIENRTPRQMTFPYAEAPSGSISVEAFFQEKYNVTLQYPDLPVINVGSARKAVYVPAEVCHILPNQRFKMKLNADQTTRMLDLAALTPIQSQAEIMRTGLPRLGLSPLTDSLSAVGIDIGGEMATVPGRILPPVSIGYRNSKVTQSKEGAWNLVGSKFNISGQRLADCGVLILSDGPGNNFGGPSATAPDWTELRETLNAFASVCTKYGLDANGAKWYPTLIPLKASDPTREGAMASIRSLFSGAFRPQIVLVIMSAKDRIYESLKHYLDIARDVHCVCSLYPKFRKGQDQYFANLAMKFNAKLGGVNHIVPGKTIEKLKAKGVMFAGADVTHPGAASIEDTPSIAGVLGTIDTTFARYGASLRLQESRKEASTDAIPTIYMITELDQMFVERLKAYESKAGAGKFPQTIVFVRDGVSEGQFQTVIDRELPLIRKACQDVARNYKPNITLLIAGKRHHTRFYITDRADADARNNDNTKAGTVVDQGVTSPYDDDFFLQPVTALKGTARPTHYTVLLDENRFTPDEKHDLLYSLSYYIARSTRGTGLAAPAYYADLACEHARMYIQGLYAGDASSMATGTIDEASVMKKAKELWGNGPNGPQLRNSMFFL